MVVITAMAVMNTMVLSMIVGVFVMACTSAIRWPPTAV
jgi:hypothetical protein